MVGNYLIIVVIQNNHFNGAKYDIQKQQLSGLMGAGDNYTEEGVLK